MSQPPSRLLSARTAAGRGRRAARRKLRAAVFALAAVAVLVGVHPALAETVWDARWRALATESNPAGATLLDRRAKVTPQQRLDLDLRFRQSGWVARGRVGGKIASAAGAEGEAREVYYETALASGTTVVAGKKALSSELGVGFRPLDLGRGDDLRGFPREPATGTPLLGGERLDGVAATSLWWLRPLTSDGERGRDQALALRHGRLIGDGDVHGLIRVSRRHGFELGGGLAATADAAVTAHAAVLYQRRQERWRHALAEKGGEVLARADPWRAEAVRDRALAVIGASWATRLGVTVIGEAWYDGRAMDSAEWRRFDALLARQRAALAPAPDQGAAAAVAGNLAGSSRLYAWPNLRRENLLLRLTRDSPGWQAAVDVLVTPADGGAVGTVNLTHQLDRLRLSAGFRRFGGAGDSAYARLPTRAAAYVELRWPLS